MGAKKYAAVSVLAALAFAAIFAVNYYAAEALSEAESVSAKAIFKEYVYKVEVAEENCTLYVPIPSKDGEVLKFADVVSARSWSIVDTEHGKMLKVRGNFEAYAVSDKPISLGSMFLLHPRFGGGNYTTFIYSTCNTSVKIRLVGYNEWWEEREFYIWKKRVKRWECYRDAVSAEVAKGWTRVRGRLIAKECYSSGCIEECLQ